MITTVLEKSEIEITKYIVPKDKRRISSRSSSEWWRIVWMEEDVE